MSFLAAIAQQEIFANIMNFSLPPWLAYKTMLESRHVSIDDYVTIRDCNDGGFAYVTISYKTLGDEVILSFRRSAVVWLWLEAWQRYVMGTRLCYVWHSRWQSSEWQCFAESNYPHVYAWEHHLLAPGWPPLINIPAYPQAVERLRMMDEDRLSERAYVGIWRDPHMSDFMKANLAELLDT